LVVEFEGAFFLRGCEFRWRSFRAPNVAQRFVQNSKRLSQKIEEGIFMWIKIIGVELPEIND
jgi:hypothetical protein